MKFLFILTFFSLVTVHATAQNNVLKKSNLPANLVLKGTVVDTLTGNAIEFASIRLLSVKDSSVITGGLTDSIGSFMIPNLMTGTYILKVSFIGYTTKTINPVNLAAGQSIFEIGSISLRPSVQSLEEVHVIGTVDVLKTGIDKKVYNVGEDINNQGSSASELLNNVPSVDVDQDGNISLRGDGNVIILVDGRPSALTLNGGLSAIPANSIERIEVVTNPSAKYDPDGTSGIINVVLKKSRLRGMNGQLTATGATGPLLNTGFNFNYRNKKWNFFTNVATNYSDGYRNFDSELSRSLTDGNYILFQDRPGTHQREGQSLRLGGDYQLSDNQTLGASVNFSRNTQERYGMLLNRYYSPASELLSDFDREAIDNSNDQNLEFNINYSNKLKKNRGEIAVDLNSSNRTDGDEGNYTSWFRTIDGTPYTDSTWVQRITKGDETQIYTGSLDYVKSLDKQKARIEAGAKMIVRNQSSNSVSKRMDEASDQFVLDTLANFTYRYNEQITAVYGIWGQEVKKWKYQVGVRGEYAQQIPYIISEDTKIVNDYFSLFPSAHLRYGLAENKEVSLSYSRRINRASSGQLNPIVNFSDPLNLRSGNPFLTPEYVNSFDLGFSRDAKKFNFTTSLFYRYTTNVIQRVKTFYDDNVTLTSFGNIDESQSYGFEAVLSYKPINWWKNALSINGDHIQYKSTLESSNFNNSGYNLSVKYSGSVEFWKKTTTVQLNAQFNSPRYTAQGKILPRGAVDLSAEKKINSSWSAGMRVSDVFNTRGFSYEFVSGNVTQSGNFKWQTRRIYLTLTYKFGKLELSKKPGRDGDAGGSGGFDF